ncbi:chromatin assembly factor 1 subunit A-like [Ostrinia nubilalis]|uniref:chromatin assembly factor 1 subunit A-like n=1 Tax=Ostrinia nubilalis TaxID=29057 RepID=UPI00308257F8
MKTSKSTENTEVTPSKKVLKQARLPFKLISEVSTSPTTPQTRKRKLSSADAETAPKIGKLSKENDLAEQAVVISDDECVDTDKTSNEEKPLNPFVKLVDTAWKKKLQRAKKKKTSKKSAKSIPNGTTETVNTKEHPESNKDEVEKMDVDLSAPEDENKQSEDSSTKSSNVAEVKATPKPRKSTPNKKVARKTRSLNKRVTKSSGNSEPENSKSEIVVLEDSNSCDKLVENKEPLVDSENNGKEECANQEEKTELIEENNEKSKDEENISPSEQSNGDIEPSKSVEAKESSPEVEEVQPSAVTPKRSARNKAKTEENEKKLDQSSSKLDESSSSNPSTPKHNRSSSVTTSLDESLNSSIPSANLTPKQLAKKLESAKKREEKEKEKLEREKKRQQEKEERAKQRQEKEEQKKKEREEKEEAKRREKEEKEELRRKEKEEKDRQKEQEKKLREEKEEQKKKEREEKEEQRKKEKEARDEEKRKKQEALELEKQEQELKKKKAAEAFVNFFVPKQKSEKDQPSLGPVSKSSVLSSFAVKSDMKLAPATRANLSDEKKQTLDNLMEEQKSDNVLYLNSLKEGHKPLSSGKTWPISDKDDDDVMIVEDELPPLDGEGEIITCEPTVREKLKPKLLSFEENKRPPYWGTWRKKSASVKPRRPFGQDQKLDYEVDSDEEWEEEPDGESVDGSAAGSDDEHDADEYEVDNDVFVPHGYLSDEVCTTRSGRRSQMARAWTAARPAATTSTTPTSTRSTTTCSCRTGTSATRSVAPRTVLLLGYEADSDEEWEEEPDGESVDGSAAGSDDEHDADEYEVDNDVFVPHGYLSDEEATMDDDDVLSLSPETQKARLKHLEDEFESEMKKPTEKIKPRLYGLLWETSDGGKPEKCVDAIWNYFGKLSMIMGDPTPFFQPSNEPEESERKKVKKKKVVNEGEKQSPKSEKKKKPKPENKESKPKSDLKKNTPEVKKNQPGINSFLTKLKST